MFDLLIKRVYEKPDKNDGYRILIDRLWPRGISKEDALIDDWFKDISPSTETRKSFDHQPDKMEEFRKIYFEELERNLESPEFLDLIFTRLKKDKVTLLYGAKDEKNNNAIVLKEWIEKKRKGK